VENAHTNTTPKTTIAKAALRLVFVSVSTSFFRPVSARRRLNAAFLLGRRVLFKETAPFSSSLNPYQYIFLTQDVKKKTPRDYPF
jgi:hypothetical protein